MTTLAQPVRPEGQPPSLFAAHRWGYFLASMVLAACAAALTYSYFRPPQQYSELIVGAMAWSLGTKSNDFATLFALVGVFFVALFLLARLRIAVLERRIASDDGLHDFIVLLCAPAAMWVAGLLATRGVSLWLLGTSAVLLVAALAFGALLARKQPDFWTWGNSDLVPIVSKLLLALLCAGLAVAAVSLAIGRLSALLQLTRMLEPGRVYWAVVAGVVLTALGLAGVLVASNKSADLHESLDQFVLALQFWFPGFFLALLPEPWFVGDRLTMGYTLGPAVWIFVSGTILIASAELRATKRRALAERSPMDLITVSSIVALLVFCKAHPVGMPTIDPDDYHFGEMLVPWWSWKEHGLIPFWDYAPARGLVNYVPGALAELFFDGSVANFSAGWPFVYVLLVFPAVFALSKVTGKAAAALALYMFPYVNGASEIDLVVTVYVAVFCRGAMLWSPRTWLGTWVVGSLGLLLYAPGQGALAAAATSPVAGYVSYRFYRTRPWPSWSAVLAYGAALLIILLATPVGLMILGAFRYGLEQSSINAIAHGIEWSASFGQGRINPLLFEIVRASWLVAALWAGLQICKAATDRPFAEVPQAIVYALPVFLLSVTFIIRAAGRIDGSGSVSRLGQASIWALALLLPLLIFTGKTPAHRAGVLAFIWLGLAGLIQPYFGGVVTSYAERYRPIYASSSSAALSKAVDAQPDTAPAIWNATQLARLTELRRVIDRVLLPGETFLDLTGRHATYFYANRPPPVEAGSIYNLVGEKQQLRAIAALEKHPVPLVLLSGDNLLFDGGPVGLRSPLLYRYLLTKPGYKVATIGKYVWLVDEGRIDKVAGLDLKALSEVDESTGNALHSSLAVGDLRWIPASWGRSFATLGSKLTTVALLSSRQRSNLRSIVMEGEDRYRVTGADPGVQFDLREFKLNGRNAGILGFDFQCEDEGPLPKIEIYWSDDAHPESELTVVRFFGIDGRLLVPLDAIPAWLLAKGIKSLRFDVQSEASCSLFAIDNVRLYQRPNVEVSKAVE